MPLRGIDISNHQGGLMVGNLWYDVDFVICKATEGTGFVDAYCDPWVQTCIQGDKPFGFYHFAGARGAISEAEYFVNNCKGYFNKGIPVLDWEGDQSVDWVNTFVNTVHDLTGIWCWIYANPWRFNQGGVEPNCARWVASYPDVYSPSFADAESWDCPYADGNVVAWQFCSDGNLEGYNGNLDMDLYYGDVESWYKYAGKSDVVPEWDDDGSCSGTDSGDNANPAGNARVIEDDKYRITIEEK